MTNIVLSDVVCPTAPIVGGAALASVAAAAAAGTAAAGAPSTPSSAATAATAPTTPSGAAGSAAGVAQARNKFGIMHIRLRPRDLNAKPFLDAKTLAQNIKPLKDGMCVNQISYGYARTGCRGMNDLTRLCDVCGVWMDYMFIGRLRYSL